MALCRSVIIHSSEFGDTTEGGDKLLISILRSFRTAHDAFATIVVLCYFRQENTPRVQWFVLKLMSLSIPLWMNIIADVINA